MKRIDMSDIAYDELCQAAEYEDPEFSPHRLCSIINQHLNRVEDLPDSSTSFLERLYELFPTLRSFDEQTGEVGRFETCLDALQRLLPVGLKEEHLVVGTYLLKMMHNPSVAGDFLVDVYSLGNRYTIR